MNLGDLEPITGSERELYNGKKGRRFVFSADMVDSKIPDCPKCKTNKKVFKACDVFVCGEFHEEKLDLMRIIS